MAPKRKLAPCPFCGGPQRGAGSGYCPKPACKEQKRTKKKQAASSVPLPSSSTAASSAPSSASIAKPPADEEAIRRHATAVQPHLVEGRVASDGNCLFRAISTHLPQGEAYHTDLRRLAVAYVAEHPDKFATVIIDEPLESWLRRMARPKEWSDNAVLQAIADRFKLCMLIWHAHLPGQRPVLVNSFAEPAERYVHLMLHEEAGAEHYNPLTLEVQAAEEVQEEQKEDRLLPVAKRRDRRSAKRQAEHDRRPARQSAQRQAEHDRRPDRQSAQCQAEHDRRPDRQSAKRKAEHDQRPDRQSAESGAKRFASQSAKRKAKSDAKQSAKPKAKSAAKQSAKRKAKSDAKQSPK